MLLDDLKQAVTETKPSLKPGIVYDGSQPVQLTTPAMPAMESPTDLDEAVRALGYPIPDGYELQLTGAVLVEHDNFWTRERPGDDAVTKPSRTFKYTFRIVPSSGREDADIAAMMAEAKAMKTLEGPIDLGQETFVVVMSDLQVGKGHDTRGGTQELLERSEIALADTLSRVDESVGEIILVDNGDGVEMFESSPTANRTNDLSMTEQVRVWRRILFRWVEALAKLGIPMKVIGVPSNHARVRQGKNALGDALDDWGIEVLAQVQDICAANSDCFGHVTFHQPAANREHVLMELMGGKVLGVIHGHQSNSPDKLPDLIKRNARQGIGQADIVCIGHFHHLRCVSFGHNQTMFIAPTMDAGSSWFSYSGEASRPGLLTFRVNESGWHSMNVCWTSDVAG